MRALVYRSILLLGVAYLFLLLASSCSRYIDTTSAERQVTVMQGHLTFYPDSNILIYKSNIGLRADNNMQKPKSFHAMLPKGLRWFETNNSQSFAFYYAGKQTVAININLDEGAIEENEVFIPTDSDLTGFISKFLSTSTGAYDFKKIGVNSAREQLMIKKGAATILLYNIEPKNYDLFVKNISEFYFL